MGGLVEGSNWTGAPGGRVTSGRANLHNNGRDKAETKGRNGQCKGMLRTATEFYSISSWMTPQVA